MGIGPIIDPADLGPASLIAQGVPGDATNEVDYWGADIELDPETRPALKKAGLLTRDPLRKESKKYGLVKARKAKQYTKR